MSSGINIFPYKPGTDKILCVCTIELAKISITTTYALPANTIHLFPYPLRHAPPYDYLHLHVHALSAFNTHLLPRPFIKAFLSKAKEKALQLYAAPQRMGSALHLLGAHLAKQG